MMGKKKQYDDDDGRTVVDMSQVSAGHSAGGWRRPSIPEHRRPPVQQEQPRREERPWEDSRLTRREGWLYALGALKAALLIGLAYLAGLGIIIALMILVWK